MPYAIIRTAGKQYRVEPGKVLRIPSVRGDAGSEVVFDEVLLSSDGDTIKAGAPAARRRQSDRRDRPARTSPTRSSCSSSAAGRTTPASKDTGRASPKCASATSPSPSCTATASLGRNQWLTRKASARRGTAVTATRSIAASRSSAAKSFAPATSSCASAARQWHPGRNVGLGRDYTIFALVDGVVKFEHKNKTRFKVSVYPETAASDN